MEVEDRRQRRVVGHYHLDLQRTVARLALEGEHSTDGRTRVQLVLFSLIVRLLAHVGAHALDLFLVLRLLPDFRLERVPLAHEVEPYVQHVLVGVYVYIHVRVGVESPVEELDGERA